ncbi:MAG: class I SAM-dependent methyltransferase [Deltaproteobacteria bacterium]|nr:class I SAM-dependent methyltransferase [Deltaproteobacteria bacterium]
MPDSAASACPKRQAFDALAPRWNSLKPDEAVVAGVERGLALLGRIAGADVIDLGCGTGRLEGVLLPQLGEGTIVAVDFSPAMISQASGHCKDRRVTWLCRDVLETGLAASSADVVLCFDAFPHFQDGGGVLREVARWLRPGGAFLLWHDVGREQLARVHHRAGPAVENDLLPSVGDLAALAAAAGLEAEIAVENESSYTLLARRPA